ncbi:MAG: glycerate kinase [bacterium]
MGAREMKIVVAPNAFKGSLTASRAGALIAEGFTDAMRGARVEVVPTADGGDGTLEVISSCVPCREVSVEVRDPLGRRVKASYLILRDEPTAVVEMARASGLALLRDEERDPMRASAYGTGELIRDALVRGCRRVIVGVGGSATNDGGMGIACAAGYRFLDRRGKELPPCGRSLGRVARVGRGGVMKQVHTAKFVVATDVKAPLCGARGAARMYARQKGAAPREVQLLDSGLKRLAEVVKRDLGKDLSRVPGAGAAGGAGFGMMAFFNARAVSGVGLVMKITGLEEKIRSADLVATGEGFLDEQSLEGKATMGVARLARRHGVPVIAFCGGIGGDERKLYRRGFTAAAPVVDRPMSLTEALENADDLLYRAAYRAGRLIARCGAAAVGTRRTAAGSKSV